MAVGSAGTCFPVAFFLTSFGRSPSKHVPALFGQQLLLRGFLKEVFNKKDFIADGDAVVSDKGDFWFDLAGLVYSIDVQLVKLIASFLVKAHGLQVIVGGDELHAVAAFFFHIPTGDDHLRTSPVFSIHLSKMIKRKPLLMSQQGLYIITNAHPAVLFPYSPCSRPTHGHSLRLPMQNACRS
ncbi:hypothetical protein PMI05_00210 [Brevibacillus sp. BC25]|nr:hypothetical protein PMI05_00210 [Brevibacillus sp. BC25]